MKYYITCLTLVKGNNISPLVNLIRAISEEDDIRKSVLSHVSYLMDGYTIESKLVQLIEDSVCPSNSDNDYSYTIDNDTDKISSLTLNLNHSSFTIEFKTELQKLLSQHWSKNLDKIV